MNQIAIFSDFLACFALKIDWLQRLLPFYMIVVTETSHHLSAHIEIKLLEHLYVADSP